MKLAHLSLVFVAAFATALAGQSGEGQLSRGGSWSVASDARLKKDVRPLAGSLAKLLELRGVSFEYLDPEALGELAGERVGFIAQEVEKVCPDWVETGADGFKKLTVRGFEALAVEALRELRAEKDAELAQLRERLATEEEDSATQEQTIARLAERLDELELAVRSR